MGMWNPWVGCHKHSDGCLHCYIHKGAAKYGLDPNDVHQTKDFRKPLEKAKDGSYKMKSGFSYLCFQSDFFLEDADEWRKECWEMIKERQDITFLFLTKRIERFYDCIPADWGNGYDNIVICCTVENQREADCRLSFFQNLPIKTKMITVQPLLEEINIEKYLRGIKHVEVGGESDPNGRVLDYAWVLNLREQCVRNNVDFVFRQVGTNFIKDGKQYHIRTFDLCKQARLANIDYHI